MYLVNPFYLEVGIWQTSLVYLQRLGEFRFLCLDKPHIRDVATICLHYPSPPSFKFTHNQHFTDVNFNTTTSINKLTISYEPVPVSLICVTHMPILTLPSASLHSGWTFLKHVYHQHSVRAFIILSTLNTWPVYLNNTNFTILRQAPYLQACGYLRH
jgi:hypothetical protein